MKNETDSTALETTVGCCGEEKMNNQIQAQKNLELRVIHTARTLFNVKGFDETTIGDITLHLNISTDQFYQHFDSLDEILEILWSGKFVEH